MAARRPAKIASKKKGKANAKVCPQTGKPMVVVKLVRANGPSGMFWVHEDFDGSNKALGYALPVRWTRASCQRTRARPGGRLTHLE